MCHYITIAVPERHAAWFEAREWPGISRVREVACSEGLVKRLKGFKRYRIGGSCGCGWFRETEAADPERDAKLWKKFANKGWSVEKTRRAYEQALAGAEPNGEPGGFIDPIPAHVETIVRETGECAIIAEWMGSSADQVIFSREREVRCSVEEFVGKRVGFGNGVLMWVGRG